MKVEISNFAICGIDLAERDLPKADEQVKNTDDDQEDPWYPGNSFETDRRYIHGEY